MEYCPRGEKKFAPFSLFVFLEVHFNAVVVIEHVMNAVSVCITETQILRCILFFYNEPTFLFFKNGMSCLPAVMYSVCKPDISETSKSEPFMLSLPFRAYTTKTIKETSYTSTVQGPICHSQNFH